MSETIEKEEREKSKRECEREREKDYDPLYTMQFGKLETEVFCVLFGVFCCNA